MISSDTGSDRSVLSTAHLLADQADPSKLKLPRLRGMKSGQLDLLRPPPTLERLYYCRGCGYQGVYRTTLIEPLQLPCCKCGGDLR